MVADTGRTNLMILRTVISEFGKAFPGKIHRILPSVKNKSVIYDQINTALQIWAPTLVLLKQYLLQTLIAKDNGEKVILWVYCHLPSGSSNWFALLSQSHFLPLTSAPTFESDVLL